MAIAAGMYHGLTLKSDGSIVGWGRNNEGQAAPPAGADFIAIDAGGGSYGLALKQDGSIVGWGVNVHGQATPPAGNDFVAIAAGMYHGLALKSDGSIVGWGRNNEGQAAPPAGADFIAIAAGAYHSLALTGCRYTLVGDVNDDCKFDFRDLAIMAEKWLLDCALTPADPACTPKWGTRPDQPSPPRR